ncbi:MAG: VOC family protein [Candidatus Methanoperedens sp.]
MIKNFRHTGIVVSDMEGSLKFYRDLLGLKVIKDFSEKGDYIDSILGLSGVHLRMVKLVTADGSMIELLQYLSHPNQPPIKSGICNLGCSHIAFTVDNIDEEYRRLLENGVRFNCSPYISPDGYAKVAFCHDPDGTSIELVEILPSIR